MTEGIKCPDCGSYDMGRNSLEDIRHCHKCKAYWKERWNYDNKGHKIHGNGSPKLERDSGIFY